MRKGKGITDEQRLRIIEEYLSGTSAKELESKYQIHRRSLSRWIDRFGIAGSSAKAREAKLVLAKQSLEESGSEQEIKALKSALARSEMRVKAYATMIEIAEQTYHIAIRKNSDTKQSGSCTRRTI
jgi:transposase-like protein